MFVNTPHDLAWAGGRGVVGCVDLIMSCAGVCLTVKSGPYIHWSLPAKICETQTIPQPQNNILTSHSSQALGNLTQPVMTQFIKIIFKRDYWGWSRAGAGI